MQTMRITVAQTISFIVVLAFFVAKKAWQRQTFRGEPGPWGQAALKLLFVKQQVIMIVVTCCFFYAISRLPAFGGTSGKTLWFIKLNSQCVAADTTKLEILYAKCQFWSLLLCKKNEKILHLKWKKVWLVFATKRTINHIVWILKNKHPKWLIASNYKYTTCVASANFWL